MTAASDEKLQYSEQFFNWVGDAGCLFPFKGTASENELVLVDIKTMKLALEHLVYDKESKCYAVQVKESAQTDELIHDPMEILPYPSDGLVVYQYDESDDYPPEPNHGTTMEDFLKKYPHSLILI